MLETWFNPWVGKMSWRRKWQPTPIFLPWRIPWTEEPGGLQSMGSINNSPPTLSSAPSPPQRFSNGPASSTSSALTNQQLPATCGARQLSKLKRFLTTLQQFGNDISPEIGEKVRTLVLALVVSTASLSMTALSMWLRTEASREICAYFSSFPNL